MPRILIIDDDAELCEMLRLILEEEGYEVETAGNGEEGVSLYCENPADVIITDIFMPEKDGIEVILDLQGTMNDLKIIVLSGGGDSGVGTKDVFVAAKEFGAQYAFPKPFEKGKVLQAVKALLKG